MKRNRSTARLHCCCIVGVRVALDGKSVPSPTRRCCIIHQATPKAPACSTTTEANGSCLMLQAPSHVDLAGGTTRGNPAQRGGARCRQRNRRPLAERSNQGQHRDSIPIGAKQSCVHLRLQGSVRGSTCPICWCRVLVKYFDLSPCYKSLWHSGTDHLHTRMSRARLLGAIRIMIHNAFTFTLMT